MSLRSVVLRKQMLECSFCGIRVSSPYLRVKLRHCDKQTRSMNTLVDTGASITLASMRMARRLALDPVIEQGDRIEYSGVGDVKHVGWGWDIEMVIEANTSSGWLSLPGQRVYFTASGLAGGDLVLGQRSFFETFVFIQRNQSGVRQRPEFVLRHPR